MISKILAGIVLWIFVSLVIAAFMNNPGSSFLDSFIAANILILVAATLVILIDGMYGFKDCNIVKGAFSNQDGRKVPVTWNHNSDCVLGCGLLEDRPGGLYFYGWFLEENEHIRNAKALIQQGLVKTLSIKANCLKWGDGKVTEGRIVEVALVLWNEQPPEYQDTLITKHKEWNLDA